MLQPKTGLQAADQTHVRRQRIGRHQVFLGASTCRTTREGFSWLNTRILLGPNQSSTRRSYVTLGRANVPAARYPGILHKPTQGETFSCFIPHPRFRSAAVVYTIPRPDRCHIGYAAGAPPLYLAHGEGPILPPSCYQCLEFRPSRSVMIVVH